MHFGLAVPGPSRSALTAAGVSGEDTPPGAPYPGGKFGAGMKAEPSAEPVRRLGPEAVRLLVLLAGAGALIVPRLWGPLLEPEEARYVEIPRQMLCHDRLLVPVLDGQDYLDKPPLLYWSVMCCYRAFGPTVWAARLVPCLAAWLTVVVVCAWVRRIAGPRAAFAAGAVLTLTGDFVYRGPMLTMNGLLGLFVVSALAAGHLAITGPTWRRGFWLLSALACGAGVLTKGPVAAALVVVPLTALLWAHTGCRRRELAALAGYAALVGLVAAPWFAAVAAREPGFVRYFFWRHHVERFASPFDHAKPAWFYLPQVALGCFPWSVVLGLIAARWLRRAGRPAVSSPAWLALLAATWGVLLFSLSGSKRPVYLLPVWPPLAVAIGVELHQHTSGARARMPGLSGRGLSWMGGVVFGILAVGVGWWLPGYSERFSVPREPLANVSGPVFCHPHRWESVTFHLGREDVRVIGDRDQFLAAVRECPGAVLVIRAGPELTEFVNALPPGLRFVECARTALVAVGVVRPRLADDP